MCAGRVINGRYRLEKPIGEGGMATIWEGTHLTLSRSIAIKFLDVGGHNAEKIRERFLREARVAAAVQHRNVVDIVDFGTAEDGRPFMVMELLVGRSLLDRMESGSLVSVGEAVRIMARTLSGLAAVHDAGIVHRDLKPENVFLVTDADGSYPKVIDFGVSRALETSGELESVLPTHENAIVGTPQYMSPEQARGLKNLDHRSDLWSAGVMLYELLTGMLPFDAEAIGDIIIQIATADPPDFVSFRPDLVGPVAEVVKRSMQRDPDERFQSAREMRSYLLAAAAQAAEEMQGAVTASAQKPVRVETHSNLPPIEAHELIAAVDDAYEPGDSKLFDYGEHLHLLEGLAGREGSRRRGARAPVGPPTADTLARPAPKKRTPLLIAGALILLGVAAGVGIFVLGRTPEPPTEVAEVEGGAQEPPSEATPAEAAEAASAEAPAPTTEPEAIVQPVDETADEVEAADEAETPAEAGEAPVVVTLDGVPEAAEVLVDGEVVDGTPLELVRGETEHEIEVRLDGRSWTTEYVATEDARYEVHVPSAREWRRTLRQRLRAQRRRRARRARRRERRRARESHLIRNPGF